MIKKLLNWFKSLFVKKQPTLEGAQDKLDGLKKALKNLKIGRDSRRTPLQQSLIRMGYRKANWN